MENAKKRKNRLTPLWISLMAAALLLGATACDGNDNNGTDTPVESNSPDVVVPDAGVESPIPSPDAAE